MKGSITPANTKSVETSEKVNTKVVQHLVGITCAIMEDSNGKHDDEMMHSCFICHAPATKKCQFCEANVYYCCQSHFELHRSKSNGETQCHPFSIQFTESVGRFMVANRDIEAGETIFEDRAAVVGPAAESLPLCLDCHSQVRNFHLFSDFLF